MTRVGTTMRRAASTASATVAVTVSVMVRATVCAGILAMPGAAGAQQAAATQRAIPTRAQVAAFTDSLVNASMRATRTPGVSVAVVRGQDTLVLKGYGFADLENRVPVTAESSFRIGSLTKQFTAAMVMKLVEEGKLRLDAPLSEYLPDYSGPGRRVTLHQLLNHTSGIPSYTGMGAKFWDVSRLDLTHAQMIDLFGRDSLQFEPGSRYAYNNSAYYLVGMIIEKVTGRSYAEHLRSTIAAPLELRTIRYCDEETVIPNRVRGYGFDDTTVVNAAPLSMNLPYAAGALCSNARDLVRWNTLLVHGRIVTPASYARMTSPTTLSSGAVQQYGYGLAPGMLLGVRNVSHSGGINGFVSYKVYYPETDLSVVVLTNSESGEPGRIAAVIARFIFGMEQPAPPKSGRQPLLPR